MNRYAVSKPLIPVLIFCLLAATPAVAQDSFGGAPSSGQQPAAPQPPHNPHSQPSIPPQGAPPVPMRPGGGAAQPQFDFTEAAIMEAEDFGVPPTDRLHSGEMGGPTPTRIPGGQVVTTEALAMLYGARSGDLLVFDVLGGPHLLPGAHNAFPAGLAGSFNDDNQREFGQYLQQVTQGNKDALLVFYCQSVYCWMSYNAALRAINLGYTEVLWYRGGINAWQTARLPVFDRQM